MLLLRCNGIVNKMLETITSLEDFLRTTFLFKQKQTEVSHHNKFFVTVEVFVAFLPIACYHWCEDVCLTLREINLLKFKKHPSKGVLIKRCSENMQLCWNHNLTWLFSCKFASYFQNTFPKNTYRRLLLEFNSWFLQYLWIV